MQGRDRRGERAVVKTYRQHKRGQAETPLRLSEARGGRHPPEGLDLDASGSDRRAGSLLHERLSCSGQVLLVPAHPVCPSLPLSLDSFPKDPPRHCPMSGSAFALGGNGGRPRDLTRRAGELEHGGSLPWVCHDPSSCCPIGAGAFEELRLC